jgi:hypothetical protein
MKIMPERWGTERLMIRDAVMEDVPHLLFMQMIRWLQLYWKRE